VRKLRAADHWYGIVDGGGNRPHMDSVLASLSDLARLRIPLPEDRWVPVARQRALGIGQCASNARKNAA
jgi:hypothetical protein